MAQGLPVENPSANPDAFDAMQAALGVQSIAKATQLLGRSVPPITGSTAGDSTFVYRDPLVVSSALGVLTFFAKATGPVTVYRYAQRTGNVWTAIGQGVTVQASAGLNTFFQQDFGNLIFKVGERIGIYGNGILAYTAETADGTGFYPGTGKGAIFTATPSTTVRLQIGFSFVPAPQPSSVDLLNAVYCETASSGLIVSVTGRVRKNGADTAFGQNVTFTAAASGKERLDLIVLDRTTLAISTVAGTERDASLDALEWQGATPANAVVIARARVNNTTAIAVSCAEYRAPKFSVRIGREGEFDALASYNRAILAPVLAKAERKETVKLGVYGDSTDAFQDTTIMPAIPTRYQANGAWRDLRDYYFTSYPSDTRAKIALFTAVQLGMADDSAGAVHTKIGAAWAIKEALDYLAGGRLNGSGVMQNGVVQYLNYSIGGTKLGTATGDARDPVRIAVPLAASLDVVLSGFGMNARNNSTDRDAVYADTVDIVTQFKAAGVIPIIRGCYRPNGSQSRANWLAVHNAQEAAAFDTGAAFLSSALIADDQNLGGIGVPSEVLCATNILTAGFNHPGIYENQRYAASFLAQLGLS